MTERRKTTHEGITPPSFCYPHAVQAPKGARGAGQVCRRHRITHPSLLLARRAKPETRRVLLLARRARPETRRVLLSAQRASPETRRVLLLAQRASPETRRVLLFARRASPKPAEFCYSHAVQARKAPGAPAKFAGDIGSSLSFASIYLCPHKKRFINRD